MSFNDGKIYAAAVSRLTLSLYYFFFYKCLHYQNLELVKWFASLEPHWFHLWKLDLEKSCKCQSASIWRLRNFSLNLVSSFNQKEKRHSIFNKLSVCHNRTAFNIEQNDTTTPTTGEYRHDRLAAGAFSHVDWRLNGGTFLVPNYCHYWKTIYDMLVFWSKNSAKRFIRFYSVWENIRY